MKHTEVYFRELNVCKAEGIGPDAAKKRAWDVMEKVCGEIPSGEFRSVMGKIGRMVQIVYPKQRKAAQSFEKKPIQKELKIVTEEASNGARNIVYSEVFKGLAKAGFIPSAEIAGFFVGESRKTYFHLGSEYYRKHVYPYYEIEKTEFGYICTPKKTAEQIQAEKEIARLEQERQKLAKEHASLEDRIRELSKIAGGAK